MEVNSGKSVHYSLIKSLTLKHDVRTLRECKLPKQKGFQLWDIY